MVGAEGGFVGEFTVEAGLLYVDKIGAGPFAGLPSTAHILMSQVIDHFGLFGMDVHRLSIARIRGGAPMWHSLNRSS